MLDSHAFGPDDRRYRTPTPRPLWCGLILAATTVAALITVVVVMARLALAVL